MSHAVASFAAAALARNAGEPMTPELALLAGLSLAAAAAFVAPAVVVPSNAPVSTAAPTVAPTRRR